MESGAKAQLFADTFSGKYNLPNAETNCYSEPRVNFVVPQRAMNVPSIDDAQHTLESLREDSATGPDMLPTTILKHCAKSLALLLRKLAVKIIDEGRWPEPWVMHWIAPIYKKRKFS